MVSRKLPNNLCCSFSVNSQQRFGLAGNPLYPFNVSGFPLAPLLPHASTSAQQGCSASNSSSTSSGAASGAAANAQLAQLAALNAALFPHAPPPSPAVALAAAAAAAPSLVGQPPQHQVFVSFHV